MVATVLRDQQEDLVVEAQVEQEHLLVALELQILVEEEEQEVEVDHVELVLQQDQPAVQESLS